MHVIGYNNILGHSVFKHSMNVDTDAGHDDTTTIQRLNEMYP